MKKIAVLLIITFLVLPLVSWAGDAPETKPVDPEWQKMNEEIISLFNEKKIPEALEKSQTLLKYLGEKGLTEGEEAAKSMGNLGMLYLSTGNYKMAQPYLLKALELRTKISGGNDPATAMILKNIAWLYAAMSNVYKERATEILEANKMDAAGEGGAAKDQVGKPAGE
ncbi:MAG: tetratricopeptide repeat protein [Proteobacteria bacterium]|nr:tetratricopeptide repeat protein [Pseudomonadota bacterium]